MKLAGSKSMKNAWLSNRSLHNEEANIGIDTFEGLDL